MERGAKSVEYKVQSTQVMRVVYTNKRRANEVLWRKMKEKLKVKTHCSGRKEVKEEDRYV